MNNNIELYTLYHLLDIDLYTKYRSTINLNYIKEYNKELYDLYGLLDKQIQQTRASVSTVEFRLFVDTYTSDSKHSSAYQAILDNLEKSFNQVSKETIELCLQKMKEKELYSRMAILSMESAEGREKSREELQSIIKELDNPSLKSSGNTLTEISEDLSVVLHNQFQKPGLRWRLNCLNKSLGSIRKGDFGFVFARPETGKTTFLTDQVTYMATQTSNPILWFNNEEQGDKVRIRLFESALGVTIDDLRKDEKRQMEAYHKITTAPIRLIDDAQITKKDITTFLSSLGETKPGLIVFDQIDKLHGFNNDREDLRLGEIYIWARELAKQYCPVIGVCQADGSGDGEKWLTMKNVANAKTSKQAEADFIIGIGMIYDSNYEHTRFINISKNKLMGDQDHDPTLRHGKFQVLIQPEIGRYKDIIEY